MVYRVSPQKKFELNQSKENFQLQISKIWVWLNFGKAFEPLFDLQESQGKTSNMAPKPTFLEGKMSKKVAFLRFFLYIKHNIAY